VDNTCGSEILQRYEDAAAEQARFREEAAAERERQSRENERAVDRAFAR
jgi:hypothetical protein